jgi:hypothetical protein
VDLIFADTLLTIRGFFSGVKLKFYTEFLFSGMGLLCCAESDADVVSHF